MGGFVVVRAVRELHPEIFGGRSLSRLERSRRNMLFPIGDDNTGRTMAPVATYLLIALNVFVFVFLQGMGSNEKFTYAFSTVPREIATGQDAVTSDRMVKDPVSGNTFRAPGLRPTPVSVYLTLLTSMFMHGGLAHLFGNMLFLWIFGDNVENAMGRARYLIFYLVCGVLAGLSHVFATMAFGANSLIPSLGASGAISGVLAGYLVLFPHRRVKVIMLRSLTEIPAFMAIGMWFLFQLISGIGVLGSASQSGGVAYAAHIGGFIAGFILVRAFASPRRVSMA
jgi:membrane associated rhomboid family serine protease